MRVKGSIGPLNRILDELNQSFVRRNKTGQSSSKNKPDDDLVNVQARDDFYLREQQLRVRRMKRQLRNFYLLCAVIAAILLYWIGGILFINRH